MLVSLSDRSYQIEIGSATGDGSLGRAGVILSSLPQTVTHCVVLTDDNVQRLGYARTVAESLAQSGIDAAILIVAAGEQSKTIETANSLWTALVDEDVDRQSVLVAVGGGVIGDLGGFVASTFLRGIRFFQVPTTLLAQVDSSVGGKVGINLPSAKNSVGAFYQPVAVLIDTSTLATLDDDQFACGLGEVAKYAVSLDESLWRLLETDAAKVLAREPSTLGTIVNACCRIKADIVSRDERETTGLRALLNFGHTFAHAFETHSEYKVLHGQAVAVGSVLATRLAVRLGLVDNAMLERVIELHKSLRLPVKPSDLPQLPKWDAGTIIKLMSRDKKVENGRLKFVLPTSAGKCELTEVGDIDEVKRILEE
ncbi:MAG: 3-dehydroquinate synthase [Planctomycetaceae bacterium]|jgi:3-dehydroquinate synthase|nr:3-dehydroquinate synthase [Planctomycetaceae bacterium]